MILSSLNINLYRNIHLCALIKSWSPEVESQFNHRKVNFKRSKDVRAVYQMIDEIGRYAAKIKMASGMIMRMYKMCEPPKNGSNHFDTLLMTPMINQECGMHWQAKY